MSTKKNIYSNLKCRLDSDDFAYHEIKTFIHDGNTYDVLVSSRTFGEGIALATLLLSKTPVPVKP